MVLFSTFFQIVSGGPKYFAEYAIIGTNCTSYDDDICIPQNHTVAVRIFKCLEGEGVWLVFSWPE